MLYSSRQFSTSNGADLAASSVCRWRSSGLTRSGNSSDYRRDNESFTTMTAAIKTWGAHTEPPKHRIKTTAPIAGRGGGRPRSGRSHWPPRCPVDDYWRSRRNEYSRNWRNVSHNEVVPCNGENPLTLESHFIEDLPQGDVLDGKSDQSGLDQCKNPSNLYRSVRVVRSRGFTDRPIAVGTCFQPWLSGNFFK
jgi:hypothetical protein